MYNLIFLLEEEKKKRPSCCILLLLQWRIAFTMIQFLKSRRKTDIWRFDRRPSIVINVNKSYRGLDRERKILAAEKLQVSNEQEGEEGVPRHLGRVP